MLTWLVPAALQARHTIVQFGFTSMNIPRTNKIFLNNSEDKLRLEIRNRAPKSYGYSHDLDLMEHEESPGAERREHEFKHKPKSQSSHSCLDQEATGWVFGQKEK